jgi:hypothetical protein
MSRYQADLLWQTIFESGWFSTQLACYQQASLDRFVLIFFAKDFNHAPSPTRQDLVRRRL